MKKEIFKDVKGYKGFYKVSNFGNIVKPGGKGSPFAFVPNPIDFSTVRNIDGNPYNNRAENLEWIEK